MINIKHTIFSAFMLASAVSGIAQTVNSDMWAVTDALGRKVTDNVDSFPKRQGKQVAIFYWTWHERETKPTDKIKNITQILRDYPDALTDYNHPAWREGYPGYCYWEEPLFGYYLTTDEWVLRKHAEMLADAKIDAVFFDCTNGTFTWDSSYKTLLKVWDKARRDGVNTPKVAFMLPFGYSPDSRASLLHLYKELYEPGLYKDLWYYWDGKPVIMAYNDNLNVNDPTEKAIRDFFTFRPGQPDYVNGPADNPNWKQWGWLEVYPQNGYVKTTDGYEEVTVGVAQNACDASGGHCQAFNMPGSYGRSYSKRQGFDTRSDAYLYGRNFSEQWSRAFELDPKLVFVTGWNEYIAGQFGEQDIWHGEPYSFVDQYSWDCSRDIEPNKGWGSRGDVYYYQLIDYVRKFKGISEPEKVSQPKKIKLTDFSAWDDVLPRYTDYKGDVMHRAAKGACNLYYTNTSGRNDIVEARVARSGKNVCFYVETDSALTPVTDNNWMLLFIDIDRNKSTGWEGYDFVVKRSAKGNGKTVLERNVEGAWKWQAVKDVKYFTEGNKLVISIPKKLLSDGGEPLNFEFKWSDNMQEEGNPMDFYVNGDVAPSARFNYVYNTAYEEK